jgi:hypothetical protein
MVWKADCAESSSGGIGNCFESFSVIEIYYEAEFWIRGK